MILIGVFFSAAVVTGLIGIIALCFATFIDGHNL